MVKFWRIFLKLNSKTLYLSSWKVKSLSYVHVLLKFHVDLIVLGQKSNAQGRVMKEQSCCLAKLKVLFFPFFLRSQSSFSHHVKVYSFMFTHTISTQVVCVNGMHTSGVLFFPSPVGEPCTVTRDTGRSETLGMSCLGTKISGQIHLSTWYLCMFFLSVVLH